MPMLRVEMMEAGADGRNGQRVDVGSADEVCLAGIPKARWHWKAAKVGRGRERRSKRRDCGVFGDAWAPRRGLS